MADRSLLRVEVVFIFAARSNPAFLGSDFVVCSRMAAAGGLSPPEILAQRRRQPRLAARRRGPSTASIFAAIRHDRPV